MADKGGGRGNHPLYTFSSFFFFYMPRDGHGIIDGEAN